MSCTMSESIIDPLLDGELSPDEAAEARAHVETCGECAAMLNARRELSGQLRQAGRYEAPDVLRARVRAIIGTPIAARSASAPRTRSSYLGRGVLAAAAVVVLVLGGRWGLARSRANAVPGQVLANHLRSLLPGHLIDVQSNDQHNVKPWFNGRVPISPDVPALDSAGYVLVGGRVDYVGATPAAVVVYKRRQHVINVFSWEAGGADAAPAAEDRNGFHLVHLERSGIESWIVSDLNRGELDDFVKRYAARR
jgi:anti-sigma factor RsiW